MQDSILQGFPDVDIQLSVIWIEMLPTDSFEAARSMASDMRDPRVRHYFDPRRTHLAGNALARGIIQAGAGPAWDVYLFYGSDAEWNDFPPMPAEWCHQLSGGQRADPARYAGGVVAERLHEAMHKLSGAACAYGQGEE